MAISRRDLFKLGGGVAAAGAMARVAPLSPAYAQAEARQFLPTDDPVHHLVNRITWGLTPDTLTHAHRVGYEAYLEEQLNPRLADPEGDKIRQENPVFQMDKRTLYSFREMAYRLYGSLLSGMVNLATHSSRQLQERMVDFWSDHFNVHINGEENLGWGILHLRNAIRPHVLGNFRSLVVATAKSPAMLRYLDNESNIAEAPNENYARELMELHTLGVDGGYTEQDVVEVARAFTGWTINERTEDGFYFEREVHDTERKNVLGHTLPAGRGIEDGLHVINILVNHPATARYLSYKLCVRFVSDDPPQSLVESTAQVWQQTDGEIRDVLRHIFTSQEFLQSVGQKFRRPLEFFIGALRVIGAVFSEEEPLYNALRQLNQIPYNWPPPNGYPDTATTWLNTNGLLTRWNIASRLTCTFADRHSPVRVDLNADLGNPATAADLVQAVAYRVFGFNLSPEQAQPFVDYVADGDGAQTPMTTGLRARKLASLYGLMLASPQYQWR